MAGACASCVLLNTSVLGVTSVLLSLPVPPGTFSNVAVCLSAEAGLGVGFWVLGGTCVLSAVLHVLVTRVWHRTLAVDGGLPSKYGSMND